MKERMWGEARIWYSRRISVLGTFKILRMLGKDCLDVGEIKGAVKARIEWLADGYRSAYKSKKCPMADSMDLPCSQLAVNCQANMSCDEDARICCCDKDTYLSKILQPDDSAIRKGSRGQSIHRCIDSILTFVARIHSPIFVITQDL